MRCLGGLGVVFLGVLLLGGCVTGTAGAAGYNGKYLGLPAEALVIESQPIPADVRVDRALVLWMEHPERVPRLPDDAPQEPYTCPEETRGHFYRGPTRISLVDTRTRRVLNTVQVHDAAEDTFDVPYLLEPEHFYRVEGPLKRGEGRPKLLDLKDLNGDGVALETVFGDAEACMGLQTTLIGYSVHQDKVMQYPVLLNGKPETWVDYLFSEKPSRPGHWDYQIDYRGRGGQLDHYRVEYDGAHEQFTGTLTSQQ